MRFTTPPRLISLSWASLLLAGLGSGCASLGLPRIDPSGERCFIWPKDEPRAAAPVFPTNPVAPPVLTDPVFPAASPGAGTPGIASPSAAPPLGTAPTQVTAGLTTPRDAVTVAPERILAPVGSEVVIKSSICTAEGYTLADQKVEWTLGRNGVGQFIEVSGKGFFHPPLLPWNKPSKVDNYLAHGYTANGPLCITRGTEDPNDDVDINRGDAWITVHSPVEGTSYVTAFAPGVEGWGERRKTAVIYWVDVQWLFPPASVSSSGRPETLTTTVTRQSDGTPIEGWVVRYEVDDGSSANAGAAQVAEVRTGPDGRASVEVSPTAAGASSSRIRAQLIRPARAGGGDEPRLVIANGETVINWTGDAPYIPSTPPAAQPPLTQPAAPPSTTPGVTPGLPSLPPAPPRKPRMEVEVLGNQQRTAKVGERIDYEVVVRNVGDGPATNVRLNAKYTPGLSHPKDTENDRDIDTDDLGPLQPGASRPVILSFDVVQPGNLQFDVTASCAEGSQAASSVQLTAQPAARQVQPGLKVEIVGPLQGTVGETLLYTVRVRNSGETALANVTVLAEFPAGLLNATPKRPGGEIRNGNLLWNIPAMQPGDTQAFDVDVRCLQQSMRATTTVTGSGEPGAGAAPIRNSAVHQLDIRPAQGGVGQPGAGGAAAGPIQVRVTPTAATVRRGTASTVYISVLNTGTTIDENVAVRILFPQTIIVDPNTIKGPTRPQLLNGELQFEPVAANRVGEELRYQITITPTERGFPAIKAQAVSKNSPTLVEHSATIEVAGP